jgi:hypothetical protein
MNARPLPPPPSLSGQPRALTRSEVQRRRAGALAGAVAWQLGWIAVLNLRHDLGAAPWRVCADVLAPLAAASIALAAPRASGPARLGPGAAQVTAWLAASAALFAGAAVLLGQSAAPDPEPFVAHALRCAAFISLFALAPVGLGGWAYARAFAVAPAWRTAALGAACGALGAATMGLVCATEGAAHVLVAHGSAVVACAVLGAWLGRRVTVA